MLLIIFFFFRSHSYPVPQRGERVKQRRMQARNWIQSFANRKLFHDIFHCADTLSAASFRHFRPIT